MKNQKQMLLATSPSQKSLTHATSDSQTSISRGFFLPGQSQKRFSRKNNSSYNSSLEKVKVSGIQDLSENYQTNNKLVTTKSIQLAKNSLNKLSSGFIKINSCLKQQKPNSTQNLARTNKITNQRQRVPRKSMVEYETGIIKEQIYTNKRSQDSSCQKNIYKMDSVAILKTQLQIKQKQVTMLEDEKRRYKMIIQDLKKKQYNLQQKFDKNQAQMKRMKQYIYEMQKKLEIQQSNQKKLEYENNKIKKQLFEANKEKKIYQRQLNMFVTNKVPKNVRQLQSCRQISLQQTVQELRIEMKKNKSETQKQMQAQIHKLKQQNINLKQEINKIQIKNRLLEKKSCDSNNYFEAYKSIKKQLMSIKCQNKKISQQCELLRNENVKIKKQIKKLKSSIDGSDKKMQINKNTKSISIIQKLDEKKHHKIQSEGQSLNLSMSICSKLDESLFLNI